MPEPTDPDPVVLPRAELGPELPEGREGSEGLEGSETGRDRLWRAVREPGRTQVVVAVLLLLVGFAAAVQIQDRQGSARYDGLREQDLIDVLDGLAGTTQRTQAEIRRLTRAREQLTSESGRRRAALQQAQQQVDALNVLAGTVPVTGPGIRLTITEVSGTVSVSSMLDVVEELRTVGAEAIAVNGTVRVVAQTSFEEGEGGLEVDGTPVEGPYVVDAIGVPSTLSRAITFSLGPRRQLAEDGAEVEVEELDSLDIDVVRELDEAEDATPGTG